MRNIRQLLAFLLAMALLAPALAEEAQEPMLAEDLSGEWEYVQPQKDPLDADIVVGYTAAAGADINPFTCNEQDLVSMNQLVFEPLVSLNEAQKPVPMLADSWIHEGNKWVFTLRKGIQCHNGQEMTAFDVEASYRRYLQCGGQNPYTARIGALISNMVATDVYTLEVTSVFPGLVTLYGMTFPVVQMDSLYDIMPRGTGPYWYVSYNQDESVRLEANPLWWKQQPTTQSIAFRHYEEVGDALGALRTGGVDIFATQSASAALNRRLSNLTTMDYGTLTYEALLPNLSDSSPLSDINVRRAIMYAIDRSVIASNAYLDMAIQSEVPVLPGTWLYESQSAVFYYSPERALQLLYDSGWKDLNGDTYMNKLDGIRVKELEITILTYNESGNSIRENAANLIASYLEAVGIYTDVEVVSKDKARERISKKDYDIALIGYNLSEAPLLSPLLHSEGNLNLNRLTNDEFDALTTQSLAAADEAEMQRLYSEIQLKLVDRLPMMGLLFRTGTVMGTRSLGGLSGIRALDMFRGMEYLVD